MLVTKGMPRGHLAVLAVSYPLLIAINTYSAMYLDGIASFAIFAFVITAIILLPIVLATVVKMPAATARLPERYLMLESVLAPDAVFAKLRSAMLGNRKVADSDAARRVLVLSSPVSGWAYGYFFPVFIRGAGAGSIIEVGILPKSIDVEPRVEKALAACAAEIKKVLA